MYACSIGCDNLSLKHNFFAVTYRIFIVETVEQFSFSLSFRKGVFSALRKPNWRLKMNSSARHEDTGPACSLFSFSFGFSFFFFRELKTPMPKKKFHKLVERPHQLSPCFCSYTHAKTLRVQSALPRSGSLL